jgi:hypothetical protein
VLFTLPNGAGTLQDVVRQSRALLLTLLGSLWRHPVAMFGVHVLLCRLAVVDANGLLLSQF